MTRPIAYGTALAVLIVATITTITSISTTNWITFSSTSLSPPMLGYTPDAIILDKIGLYRRCTTIDGVKTCSTFPDEKKCSSCSSLSTPDDGCDDDDNNNKKDKTLCSTWKTAGFLMILAVLVEIVTVVGFVLVIGGGREKRRSGWKLLCFMLALAGVFSFGGMSLVAILLDQDDMFNVPGYKLDRSWYLATVSGAMTIAMSCGLALSAWLLAPEDGYEILRDSPGVHA